MFDKETLYIPRTLLFRCQHYHYRATTSEKNHLNMFKLKVLCFWQSLLLWDDINYIMKMTEFRVKFKTFFKVYVSCCLKIKIKFPSGFLWNLIMDFSYCLAAAKNFFSVENSLNFSFRFYLMRELLIHFESE